MRSSGTQRHLAEPYANMLDVEAVMEAVMKKRAELEDAAGEDFVRPDFHVVLRGGNWLFKHTGKEYNELRAEAKGEDAVQWCIRSGHQQSFTASLAAYGEAVCMTICKAWAAKMQFLFDGHMHGGGEDEGVGAEPFVEDPEVDRCYHAGGALLRKRIDQIRALH